jgi:hypothetical protein
MPRAPGLANRRSFDETIERQVRRAERSGPSISRIMIDIAQFKACYDSYGHPAGHECLRVVARAIHGCLRRAGDCAARYMTVRNSLWSCLRPTRNVRMRSRRRYGRTLDRSAGDGSAESGIFAPGLAGTLRQGGAWVTASRAACGSATIPLVWDSSLVNHLVTFAA